METSVHLPADPHFENEQQVLTMNRIPEFKLVLIGDGGVGKTTFLKRHLTGEFETKYIATLGVEVHPLILHTNFGPLLFNCWDTAGQEKFGGMRDAYYMQGQCAIIMFDLTSRISYKNVPNWHSDLTCVCGDIPIVICGNKVDDRDRRRKRSTSRSTARRTCRISTFRSRPTTSLRDPSCRSPVHLLMTTTWQLLRLILQLVPPEMYLTPEQIAQIDAEMATFAASVPLPDEDEDL